MHKPAKKSTATVCCCALVYLFLLGAAANGFTSKIALIKENAMSIINARKFGELCNNALVPYTTTIQGATVWKSATPLPLNPQPASCLSIAGNTLFVVYNAGAIAGFDKNSGAHLWTVETRGQTEFTHAPQGVIDIGEGSILAYIGASGKKATSVRLPFAGDGRFCSLQQSGKEFRYSYQLPPRQTNAPSDQVVGPAWSYLRYAPDDADDFRWEIIKPGFLRNAFFNQTQSLLCVVGDTCFYILTTDGTSDKDCRTIACQASFCGGFTEKNDLLAVLTEKVVKGNSFTAQTSLSAFDLNGKKVWSYLLPDDPRTAQPPAAIGDGEAAVLIGNELKLISAGTQRWSFEMPCDWQSACFTVLKDRSILAAAGNQLIHIAPDGKEIKRVLSEDYITCRPIVDEKGTIFVAGAAGIRAYR
jgi:outer membrane protein assembly factor BamB